MRTKQIVFTEVNTAQLLDVEARPLGDEDVMVRTVVSTISAGTERANITGDPNVAWKGEGSVVFPRTSGYSSAGEVLAVGDAVKSVKVGDRVVVFWGKHMGINVVPERNVVKIEDDATSYETGALSFIASFPMAAIRKTRLEMGESALVMGQGILGILAVKLLRAAGAVPIIAADPNPSRRALALQCGADYALDPLKEGFADRVKALTHNGAGVNVAIEVTGVGAGLNGALDCMARFGRVALLGCTRNSDFTVDYYKKVHGPGITIVGAHTSARPKDAAESHPAYFTHNDDIRAVLKLCAGGRMTLADLIGETDDPSACEEVYRRLIDDKNFPVGVQFDWRNTNGCE